MKKVIAIFLTLSLVIGCTSKQEEEPIIEDKPLVEIESISPSDYYTSLTNVYLTDRNGKDFLILVPNEYNQVDASFMSLSAFNGEWTITLSEVEDLEDYMESYDYFVSTNDCYDSGILYANGTYSRNIFLKEGELNMFYFAMNKDDITIKLFISYVESELDDIDLQTLKELKEVYLLDLLDLPDEIYVNPDDHPLPEVTEETGE